MEQKRPQEEAPSKLKELRREFNALFETLFRVLKEIEKAEKKEAPSKNSPETAKKAPSKKAQKQPKKAPNGA